MKKYRAWSPTQSYLLPPSPTEWLPEGHLAYFVLDLVGELDVGAIENELQRKDARGERPFAPRMMVSLLTYAYATGVFSSRKIARSTYEDVAFRVIAGGDHPHFTTVNQFRQKHRDALAGLFGQVLHLCQSAGLVKLGHVAIDGSKVKANASKHKAMSYERMQKQNAELSAEVEELLSRADAVDAQEDELYGVGQDPEDLPAELQRREGRRAKIRAALAALEKDAAQTRAQTLREQQKQLTEKSTDSFVPSKERKTAATLANKRGQQALALEQKAESIDSDDDDPPAPADDLPRHRTRTRANGKPHPKAQRNFTDPDSRIMKRDGAFIQAYNVHLAVDEAHQVIVAEAVTNQPPDNEHFKPMLRKAVENCRGVPERTTADAGYFSDDNVEFAERMGTEPFVSPNRQRHQGAEELTRRRDTRARTAMRALLQTPRGKAAYARRKCTVEPVFGQIFAARGFRQFLLRGLRAVRFEWGFLCTTHNILKLFRATWSQPATG